MLLQREETEAQMPEMDLSRVAWRKSRHSGNGSNCVEVGTWAKSSYSNAANGCVEATAVITRDGIDTQAVAVVGRDGLDIPAVMVGTEKLILLRDSKNPDDGTLAFCEHEWSAFVAGIKSSEFDLPDRTPSPWVVQRESVD